MTFNSLFCKWIPLGAPKSNRIHKRRAPAGWLLTDKQSHREIPLRDGSRVNVVIYLNYFPRLAGASVRLRFKEIRCIAALMPGDFFSLISALQCSRNSWQNRKKISDVLRSVIGEGRINKTLSRPLLIVRPPSTTCSLS